MWTKWVFIASVGAATSLMRASVGEIVASAEATATPTPLLALSALALRIHNRRLEAASGA